MPRIHSKAKTATGPSTKGSTSDAVSLAPFCRVPEAVEPLLEHLDPSHVYVVHVDGQPRAFKRRVFAVPVLMNVVVVLLMVWRLWTVGPWYLQLLETVLYRVENETTVYAVTLTWREFWAVALRRTLTLCIDGGLAVFVWPWPWEFCVGGERGNAVRWRLAVGFRDQEVYVRRSRRWDQSLAETDLFRDLASLSSADAANTVRARKHDEDGDGGRAVAMRDFLTVIQAATSSLLLRQKTGYVLQDDRWELDWDAMILATVLVDKKTIPLDALRPSVVLLHPQTLTASAGAARLRKQQQQQQQPSNDRGGWLSMDLGEAQVTRDEVRRRHVLVFREALAALGHEALFYRWIELVQYESTQPGGFGPERQEKAALEIRRLFAEQNIDFDALWKEAVGETLL